MSILPHLFDGANVSQASEDFYIGRHRIPKGYVNLTEMCKAGNKKLSGYTRLKRTEAYVAVVANDTSINTSDLFVEVLGGGYSVRADEQGTWGHHLIALSLAAWISPEFELLANKVLWGVINGDSQALTEELEHNQALLKEGWQKIRDAGKSTRRTLTDSIKAWYTENPNATTRPMGVMIAQVTNLIYQAMWGMDAMQLEEYLGCGRHESRDHLSEPDLKVLDRMEGNVMDFIDYDSIKPVDAVPLARIRRQDLPTHK